MSQFVAGTLNDPQVAGFMTEHCVATHKQVGDFRVRATNRDGRRQDKADLVKTGGNLVSYFISPSDGVVLVAEQRQIGAERFLALAKRALTSHQATEDRSREEKVKFLQAFNSSNAGASSKVLAASDDLSLLSVQKPMWELAGEEWLDEGDSMLQLAIAGVSAAKKYDRKLMFILHQEDRKIAHVGSDANITRLPPTNYMEACQRWELIRNQSLELHTLAKKYVVIAVGENYMSVLSAMLGDPPYAIAETARLPAFVVPDGKGSQWSIGSNTTDGDIAEYLVKVMTTRLNTQSVASQ